jgi:NADPH2:quinone reductase
VSKPDLNREIGARVEELVERGAIRPVVGARFPLERGADALRLLDGRGATGKVVLEVTS